MRIERTSTILYCDRWTETVEFYRDVVELRVTSAREWFVEFELGAHCFVAIADAARTTIPAVNGAGITLSWQVGDVERESARLAALGVECSPVVQRWGGDCTFLVDPEGHRVELWAPAADPGAPGSRSQ